MGDHLLDLDVDRVLQNLAKYNRIFGGGPVSFWQVIFFLIFFFNLVWITNLHVCCCSLSRKLRRILECKL